jgi:4-hydroxybenzoate polyprenyltransferase
VLKLEQKWRVYSQLMRLDKPIGILLLLWPTLMGLWLAAEGIPSLSVLIIFTLGVIIMRSAGCVINDYADRDFDGQIERTAQRPLAAGTATPKEALLLFCGLGLIAFLLVLFLNKLTILMSVVGLLLAAAYPFMKRYTYLPQLVLGMAFGWAIPMAFAAQSNEVPTVAWLLFLANIVWSIIYDTFYAMADREEDLVAGVKSTAILFGDDDLTIIGILQFIFVLIMALIGSQLNLGWPYFVSLIVTMGLFIYQQKIAAKKDAAHCLHAFLNNNWVGAALFLGIAVHYFLV